MPTEGAVGRADDGSGMNGIPVDVDEAIALGGVLRVGYIGGGDVEFKPIIPGLPASAIDVKLAQAMRVLLAK